MHTERENIAQKEKIDFESEACVDRWITAEGVKYLDMASNDDITEEMVRFSLMKHGHTDSVDHFSGRLARSAMASSELARRIVTAQNKGQNVFITSPGIYNVPSSSNLLLWKTASLLNLSLTRQSLWPIKVAEQIRLGESNIAYAQLGKVERQKDQAGRSHFPGVFKDNFVIYLDDIYITGTVANRAKEKLKQAGVADFFFLFAAAVDPRVVELSDGKIEDRINRKAMDSVEDVVFLLNQEFIPTQKTLVSVLSQSPEILCGLFALVPVEALLKIYVAQAQNGFLRQWGGAYGAAVKILENYLLSIGVIDEYSYPKI